MMGEFKNVIFFAADEEALFNFCDGVMYLCDHYAITKDVADAYVEQCKQFNQIPALVH